ncbi:MAG: hypothetical protein ABL925_02665 [Methylococcales bacterium]
MHSSPDLKVFKGMPIRWFLVVSLLAFTTFTQASTYSYTILNPPDADPDRIYAYGINNSGQVAGQYFDINQNVHGFVYNGSNYTTLNVPNARETVAVGINDSGQVIGQFSDGTGFYNVLFSEGTYTTLDLPINAIAYGINNNGQIVGTFHDDTYHQHGFMYDGNAYSALDIPNAVDTWVYGVNDSDQVVGSVNYDGLAVHGFIYNGGNFKILDAPNGDPSYPYTWAQGVNNSGQVVGAFSDPNGNYHGFIYNGGTFTVFDPPTSRYTWLTGINDRGQVVGYFYDTANHNYSFLATPVIVPIPAAAWLFITSLACWAGLLGLNPGRQSIRST